MKSIHRPVARALLVWAVVLSISAASLSLIAAQGTPDASPSASPQASPAASPGASPAAGDVDAFLQTPVGQQFAWFFAALNGEGEEITPEVFEERFSPSFIQGVPYDAFMETFNQLQAGAPWTLVEVFPVATDLNARVTIQGTGQTYTFVILVDDSAEHQIAGLILRPAAPPT